MSLADIHAQILEAKRARLAHLPSRRLEEMREEALEKRKNAPPHLLREAIKQPDRLNIIAEIKRTSPWQDAIHPEINLSELALAYSNKGVAAISVWTEEDYFHGSLDDLRAVRAVVSLPVLRQDFIIEPSQVYETVIAGSDALLLLVSAVDENRLKLLLQIAEEDLGLDALVEVQTANEMLRAHSLGATLIVVNNRNISTSEVSLDVSVDAIRSAPQDILLLSKHGLRTKKQLRGLQALGYTGFLIGESLNSLLES